MSHLDDHNVSPQVWECAKCGIVNPLYTPTLKDKILRYGSPQLQPQFVPTVDSPVTLPATRQLERDRCGHPLTHDSILYHDDGIIPIKSAGGLNLCPERLIPAGWVCCYHHPFTLSNGGRPPISVTVKTTHDGQKVIDHVCPHGGHNEPTPCVPALHCKQCLVVNMFNEPLIYLDNNLYLDAKNDLLDDMPIETYIPAGALAEHWNHYYHCLRQNINPSLLPGATTHAVRLPQHVLLDCALFAKRIWEDCLARHENVNVNHLHPRPDGHHHHHPHHHATRRDFSFQGPPPYPYTADGTGYTFTVREDRILNPISWGPNSDIRFTTEGRIVEEDSSVPAPANPVVVLAPESVKRIARLLPVVPNVNGNGNRAMVVDSREFVTTTGTTTGTETGEEETEPMVVLERCVMPPPPPPPGKLPTTTTTRCCCAGGYVYEEADGVVLPHTHHAKKIGELPRENGVCSLMGVMPPRFVEGPYPENFLRFLRADEIAFLDGDGGEGADLEGAEY